MAKKKNYFKGLMNAIIKIEDLQTDVQNFKEQYDDESEILYDDLISILTKIARYFVNLEDIEEEFDEKQIEDTANALIGLYKNKHKNQSKEIKGKELKKFRELINIILFSLGYYPLNVKGEEEEDETEVETFEEEVYNVFNE
jgi:hypothetical protein